MKKIFFLFFVLTTIIACNQNKKKCIKEMNAFKIEADSISNFAQKTLLKELSAQINKNGFAASIQYCNVHASPIIDSLAANKNVIISRISEKYRNENNKPDSTEKILLQKFEKNKIKDTVICNNNKITYYKAINVALPTCLKCHGNSTDIDPDALQMVGALYPNDHAIGYQLNDFRGFWKIIKKNN